MPRLRTRLAGMLFAALVAALVTGCGAGGGSGAKSGASLSARRTPAPQASPRHSPTPPSSSRHTRKPPRGRRTPTPGASARHKSSSRPAARRTPTPVPSPRVGPPAATQDLTFSGDLNGTMTELVTQSAQTPSACSERPVEAATWASTLYGTVDGEVYGFVATVKPYNGPGTYSAAQTQVQLFSVSDQQKTWESLPGDSVSFTVHNDNLTGSVEATLTNLGSNVGTLSVTGDWSCAP